jgi:hypothetical protein
VNFKITEHAGHHKATRNPAFAAPADALPRLLARLGPRRDGVKFRMVGNQLRASYGGEPPVSMTRDERVVIARLAVLKVVLNVCEEDPDLNAEWYAVSEVTGRDQLR